MKWFGPYGLLPPRSSERTTLTNICTWFRRKKSPLLREILAALAQPIRSEILAEQRFSFAYGVTGPAPLWRDVRA